MNILINTNTNHSEPSNTDQARRMLREIAHMAEEASLTGGIKSGASRLAEFYNRVLQDLEQAGQVSGQLFEPIDPATADFGRIAVDATMLGASIGGGKQRLANGERAEEASADILCGLAPFLESEQLGMLVKEKLLAGVKITDQVLMGLAPFLHSEMLSDLVRTRLTNPTPPTPPSAPEAPAAPTPESDPQPAAASEPREWSSPIPDTTVLASIGSKAERIKELAGQLSRPDLTEEERGELLQQIGALTWPSIS